MKTIPEKVKASLVLFSLLSVVLLVFLPVTGFQFLNWDDDYHVYQNRSIDSFDRAHISQIFLDPVGGAVYFPLTISMYAFEKHVFGLNPKIFHLNNLILHLCVVLLVFYLGVRCGLSQAASVLAAFIFGIHPIHAETVAWVTERKDLVYSIFYLLAVIQYTRYLKDRRVSKLLLCYLLGYLSMLSKPMALSLPLVLLVFDRFFERPFGWRIFLEKIPLIGLLPLAWITFSILKVEMFVPSWNALWVLIWQLGFYLRQFFLPIHLTPLYPLPQPIGWGNPEYAGALLIVAMVLVVAYLNRRDKWVVFALGYFFFSIFFLLRASTESLGHVYVADHYMYLPSLGLCFLCGSVVERSFKSHGQPNGLKAKIVSLVVVGIMAGMAWKTVDQLAIWKDNFSFWGHVLKHNPDLSVGYLNRGIAYAQGQNYKSALKDFDQAVMLDPKNSEAFNNRANIFSLLGDHKKSVEDYTTAINLENEECSLTHCPAENSSMVKEGKRFHKVSRYNALMAKLLTNRAKAYMSLNNVTAALNDLNEASVKNPYLFDIYLDRGRVQAIMRNWQAALNDLTQAVKLNPRSTAAMMERSVVLFELGYFRDALAGFDKVLSSDPGNASVWYYKARAELAQGNEVVALEYLNKATKLGFGISPEEFIKSEKLQRTAHEQ